MKKIDIFNKFIINIFILSSFYGCSYKNYNINKYNYSIKNNNQSKYIVEIYNKEK